LPTKEFFFAGQAGARFEAWKDLDAEGELRHDVIPAKAGISVIRWQGSVANGDSRFRGNDIAVKAARRLRRTPQ
jgi:hypothetical protein